MFYLTFSLNECIYLSLGLNIKVKSDMYATFCIIAVHMCIALPIKPKRSCVSVLLF